MRPTDYQVRERAISEPGVSCIIQAPAGSGKTGLLVQRYLCLLSVVDAPEEIIAITFTRKAAAEMQGRVLHALRDAADNASAQDPHHRLTLQLATEALRRDAARHWGILENPSRLRMQTIDSLCHWLSGQLPLLSGLGAPPTIRDDVAMLYQQAAIRTLAMLDDDVSAEDSRQVAVLLSHLDNSVPGAVRQLSGMLGSRDQWLRHTVNRQRRKLLEDTLQQVIRESLSALRERFPQSCVTTLCALLRFAAENLSGAGQHGRLCECVDMRTLPPADIDALPQWLGVAELLLTGQGHWRSLVNKNTGFPAGSKDRKQEFRELMEQLRQDDVLLHMLVALRELPDAHYHDTQWEVIDALCHCLNLAEAHLRVCLSEHNCIDYIGMARAAMEALGEEEAPADLALYLDYRIRHLLVDEFQDISASQYRLLQKLCAGWSPDDGHSLFLVGDPMQSIYRFREAEVSFFLNTFRARRLGQVPLLALRLQANFRSTAELVEWNNECFNRILPAVEDIAMGAVGFTRSEAACAATEENPVTIYPAFDADRRCEASQVGAIVRRLRKFDPAVSIAVLARNRRHLQELIALLRSERIPFRAVEIERLGERPAIQDLFALTNAWLHPADRIAWLAVLRAPWCGLSLEELLELVDTCPDQTVWQRLEDERYWAKLNPDSRICLRRFVGAMGEAMDCRQKMGLARTIEHLWHRLGGAATLNSADELADIDCFFGLLDQFDSGGGIEYPQQFTERLQGLFAESASGPDSLQLMTIHRAKGLEFDHVILPQLGHVSRSAQRPLLLWDMRVMGDGTEALMMASIQRTGGEEGKTYQHIWRRDRARQSFEEQRLLYVACTRAKRGLHLFGHARLERDRKTGEPCCSAHAGTLLHYLWPVVEAEFRQAAAVAAVPKHAEITTHQSGVDKGFRRLVSDWRLPCAAPPIRWFHAGDMPEHGLQPLEAIEYDWAQVEIRHVGSVVHRLLKHYAEHGPAGGCNPYSDRFAELAVRLLREHGLSAERAAVASAQVLLAFSNTLEDETGRWVLDQGHREAMNECPLSGMYHGELTHVVIDRSFVDKHGDRWIIDYKTSSHAGGDVQAFLDREQERHRPQLEKYAAIMRPLSPQPIRMGLYFPLLKAWREYR